MTIRDGICPKCNSGEIYQKQLEAESELYGHNPLLYVCTVCGFYEHYIADRQYLHDIKDQWTPVKPKRKPKKKKIDWDSIEPHFVELDDDDNLLFDEKPKRKRKNDEL